MRHDSDDRSYIKVQPPSDSDDERQRSPLEEAEEVLHAAYGETQPARRIAKARQALTISKDCASAYILLAEESEVELTERIELYRQAVEAGERTLGTRAFEDHVGHFWGILEARPYLRARLGLADCLWRAEERKKAIEHYRMLLKLNPGDHQKVRYRLLKALLAMKLDEAAEHLLRRYEDEISVTWMYTAALVAFRRHGAQPGAAVLRDRAVDHHPKGAMFLLHRSRIPQDEKLCFGLPETHRDAIDYARVHGMFWDKTAGALVWLAAKAEPARAQAAVVPTRAMNSADLLAAIAAADGENSDED